MQYDRISIDVMQRNERWLRKLALDLTRDSGAADDLVQDTFVEVLRKPSAELGIDSSTTLRAYLGGVLRNLYKMKVRTAIRREKRESRFGDEQLNRSVDDALDERWAVSTLMEEIDKLSEPFRTTLLLRYYEGLAANEIATRLGVPCATVRKRHQLALDKLRNRLDNRSDGDRGAWLRAVSRVAAPAIPAATAKHLVAASAVRRITMASAVLMGLALVLHWSPLSFPGSAGASATSQGVRKRDRKMPLPSFDEQRNQTSQLLRAPHQPPIATVTQASPDDVQEQALQSDHELDSEAVMSAKQCGSLQTLIDTAPAAARITLPQGCIFREKVLVMKPLTLVGAVGTEIRGSDVWKEFTQTNSAAAIHWTSTLAVPEFPDEARDCLKRNTGPCVGPEQVYRDGKNLERVALGTALQANQFTIGRDRHVVLGSDPKGHEIEVTTRLGWMSIATHDVVLDGLRMRHAGSPQYGLAIINPSERVTIRNSEFSDGSGVCVVLAGVDHRFENNKVHHCGFETFRLEPGRGTIVKDNDFFAGGLANLRIEWTSAGIGIILQENAVIQGNRVYRNNGVGIMNIHGNGLAVVDNNVHDNTAAGIIFYEVDAGLVKGNTVWSNAAKTSPPEAGIFLTSTKHVEVASNTFAYHPFAVYVGPRRGELPLGFEPCNDTAGNLIHHNVLIANGRKRAGIVNSGDPREQDSLQPCSTNRFENNSFWPVPDNPTSQLLSLADRDRWLEQKNIPLK